MHIHFGFLVFLSAYAAAVNTNCPSHLPKTENLVQFGQSCYEFIFDHPGDWFHANQDCQAKRGHLVDIHSYAEEGFLFNTCQQLGFHGDKGLWIGLTDHDDYKGEGNWHWTSNKPISFVAWADGQPGMVGGAEDCVLMEFADHGQWHDYPCSGFLFVKQSHGWICEYAVV